MLLLGALWVRYVHILSGVRSPKRGSTHPPYMLRLVKTVSLAPQDKLRTAAQLREARLTALAAKAAQASIKVEQAREREEAAAAERRAALNARLTRAELWRKECLAARASCQPAVSCAA